MARAAFAVLLFCESGGRENRLNAKIAGAKKLIPPSVLLPFWLACLCGGMTGARQIESKRDMGNFRGTEGVREAPVHRRRRSLPTADYVSGGLRPANSWGT